jgi:hypothetical protein
MNVNEVGKDISHFGVNILGVAVGQVLMGLIPSTGNPAVDKFLPGALGLAGAILITSKAKDQYAKEAAKGLGIAGTANLIHKLTAGKTGILAKVNQATNLPQVNLNGFHGFRGLGEAAAMLQLPQATEVPASFLS